MACPEKRSRLVCGENQKRSVEMKPILVVLAAGMGSRYGGVKQIEAVGKYGETLLDFSTFDAVNSGFGKVVYIIRKDIEKDFRERIFDRLAKKIDASYVFQSMDSLLSAEQIIRSSGRTKPWGTVHAVLCAKAAVDSPFAVINADDYYGRNAYGTLCGHLSSISCDSTEHAMVGYVLQNTMSRNGTVTRGVCTQEDGFLVSMTETSGIGYDGDRIIAGTKEFTGKEWVSMNFFGFSPRAFEFFDEYFSRFIEEQAASATGESLLPTATSEMVDSGKGTVRFYTTDDQWFGMTYQADRQLVKDELAKKISQNYYPQRLWVDEA